MCIRDSPDYGKLELNLDTMRPSLAYLVAGGAHVLAAEPDAVIRCQRQVADRQPVQLGGQFHFFQQLSLIHISI